MDREGRITFIFLEIAIKAKKILELWENYGICLYIRQKNRFKMVNLVNCSQWKGAAL